MICFFFLKLPGDIWAIPLPSRWRHNEHDGVSNTSITNVYSTIYSGADQRKHPSSASLAFVRGIHRWPVNSPHKGPVTREMSPLMTSSCYSHSHLWWYTIRTTAYFTHTCKHICYYLPCVSDKTTIQLRHVSVFASQIISNSTVSFRAYSGEQQNNSKALYCWSFWEQFHRWSVKFHRPFHYLGNWFLIMRQK